MKNPTHTYDHAGTYSVRLMVPGPGASDTEIKTDYIRIALPGGDINDDSKADLVDIILVLQILAGLEPQPALSEIKDINGDMRIGLEEAAYILQFVSGMGR